MGEGWVANVKTHLEVGHQTQKKCDKSAKRRIVKKMANNTTAHTISPLNPTQRALCQNQIVNTRVLIRPREDNKNETNSSIFHNEPGTPHHVLRNRFAKLACKI
ncbi:hypothetical protein J6590_003556 [Homalodisca vitripennis]|nr:hypothetical protein J6590_003556 [Homalodisca vitripennis]